MSFFTPSQIELVDLPLAAHVFLEGPAGCGKTTVAVERLLRLMASGVPGGQILLLLPQRTLGGPFEAALQAPGVIAGSSPSLLTAGGLAQRMVELFWPLVADEGAAASGAGFAHPDRPPVFLTLETAQYHMAHLARPLFAQGYFASVTIERNRLYSQVLDSLNKSALVGFPLAEIGERLKAAWNGEPSQLRVYQDVQYCAGLFRQHCLDHNLLDFSLQVEVFWKRLWPDPLCRSFLQRTYRHLIFDNLEEDTPFACDLLHDWLPDLDSALVVYDHQAGYRRFLGADPQQAYRLKAAFPVQAVLEEQLVNSPSVWTLSQVLGQAVRRQPLAPALQLSLPEPSLQPRPLAAPLAAGAPAVAEASAAGYPAWGWVRDSFSLGAHRFFPQMLDWVAAETRRLVFDEGLSPAEIVILAPFLSDALRFSLANRLEALGVPVRSHRPSRSLRDEPAARTLLTLACLAHPAWGMAPDDHEVAYALVQAIDGLDLVRARLLVGKVYRSQEPVLAAFDHCPAALRERISYRLGQRYEALRLWLLDYQEQSAAGGVGPDAFDAFLSRLFGELLSQPGFGFHVHLDAGRVAANLVESVRKFRWVTGDMLAEAGVPLGLEYLMMVADGVLAAQYLGGWQPGGEDAVLLAPAYTFLMSNRPVAVQFWLDIGSRGWSERLDQPLTQPYVLSRSWEPGRLWTDHDEVQASQQALESLVAGLLNRLRQHLYLAFSDLGEQGFEQRGPLLHIVQRLLRALPQDALPAEEAQ